MLDGSQIFFLNGNRIVLFYPPASEASMEVGNITEIKNLHTPVSGVKEFVCPSVCLSVTNFDLNYKKGLRSEKR